MGRGESSCLRRLTKDEGIRELICNYQLTDSLRFMGWSLVLDERLVLCFYKCISHGVEYCEVMVQRPDWWVSST